MRRTLTTLLQSITLVGLLGVSFAAHAQQTVIPVWPGAAPGAENWTQKEVESAGSAMGNIVRNVVRPTLTAYLPDRSRATGAAVIVCPGGGFRFLSWKSEGTEVAEWLRDHGVAAFVLKYRLVDTGSTEEEFRKALSALFINIARLTGNKKSGSLTLSDLGAANIPLLAAEDGRQAIRLVRKRASEWHIAPDRIGILGFSAGGIVADEAALHYDADSRPNFVAPIYGPPFGEIAVPADAPPMFLLWANDDALVADGCMRLYSAWKAAGKPIELHIYAKGGHGFGMKKQGLPTDHWIERFGDWLEMQGLLKPPR